MVELKLERFSLMASTPVPGSYMLSARLSCIFMAPDGTLQSWDVPLDVPTDSAPHKGKNKKRKPKNKKWKLKKKKRRLQGKTTWKSQCPEHIPEKVFPTGLRDNGEWSWQCVVCKADL